MNVHLFSGSGYSWRVLLALAIKGQRYGETLISPSQTDLKSREFLTLNLRGKVPVIQDGPYVLAESSAILAYLERRRSMRPRFLLAMLAYIVPTFPIGYFWHLVTFKSYYESLQVYRDDILIPFGLLSMLVQSVVWAYLYSRLFTGEPALRGAAKFAAVATPLAWSFMVIAVAAKHHMASVAGFVLIETAFIVVQYAVVSPLIALAFRRKEP